MYVTAASGTAATWSSVGSQIASRSIPASSSSARQTSTQNGSPTRVTTSSAAAITTASIDSLPCSCQ